MIETLSNPGFEDVATALWKINSVQFSNKKALASGLESAFYIDAGVARTHPSELLVLARAMEGILLSAPHLPPKFLAGIPEGTTPLVTTLSLLTGIGQLTPNIKDPKWEKNLELIGDLRQVLPFDPVSVIEDVVTTGHSTIKGIQVLEAHKLEIVSVLALVDRGEKNGRENILSKAPCFKAFCHVRELLDFYRVNRFINEEQFNKARNYFRF